MTRKATFGTVSHGTLRDADLIDSFAGELRDLLDDSGTAAEQALLRECDAWEDFDDENDDQDAIDSHEESGSELVSDLIDALENYAPAYGYFGSIDGDGADFGFWLIDDFQMRFQEDGGLTVRDTSEVPADYSGEVLHVNDHGNCTLYTASAGDLTEIWATV